MANCCTRFFALGSMRRSRRRNSNLECAAAGGFQSLMPEAVGVPEDADRGAEALLRMRLLAQDDLDQRRCLRPDLIRSALDALRRPVGIAPVARRHVLAHGRVLAVR